jgi:hypothetical protein
MTVMPRFSRKRISSEPASPFDSCSPKYAEALRPIQQLPVTPGFVERPLYAADDIDQDADMNVNVRVDPENALGLGLPDPCDLLRKGKAWRRQTSPKDRTLTVQVKARIRALAAGSALPK